MRDTVSFTSWWTMNKVWAPEAWEDYGDLSGFWSRRIDECNRLVYRIVGSNIEIASCRYHYGKS